MQNLKREIIRNCDKKILAIVYREITESRFPPRYCFAETALCFFKKTGIRYSWKKVERLLRGKSAKTTSFPLKSTLTKE